MQRLPFMRLKRYSTLFLVQGDARKPLLQHCKVFALYVAVTAPVPFARDSDEEGLSGPKGRAHMATNSGRQGAAWRLTIPWRALIRGFVLCLVLAGWLAPAYRGLPVAAAGTTRY